MDNEFTKGVKSFANIDVIKSIAKMFAFGIYVLWMFIGAMFWTITVFQIANAPYDYYMNLWEKMWVISP